MSREQSWKTWLNNPVNEANLVGNKDDVLERLDAIAHSYTEETLNKSAQGLENSEVWRLSEGLRDWFSTEWLAEAKVKISFSAHYNAVSKSKNLYQVP